MFSSLVDFTALSEFFGCSKEATMIGAVAATIFLVPKAWNATKWTFRKTKGVCFGSSKPREAENKYLIEAGS